MDNIKCKIYTFFYVLVLVMMPLLIPLKGYSQAVRSVISDGSVLGQSSGFVDFSLLELSSTDRGFLLSRMTTAEKEAIPAADLVQGLIIFNTDTSCIEYYDNKIYDWLSVCGDLGPADFVLTHNSCTNIQAMGKFAKDAFLSPNENLLNIQVTVTKPGSYQIRTKALNTGNSGGLNKDNNYTFKAEGTFLYTGDYTVTLKATGKPLYAGYQRVGGVIPAGVGDKITLYLNNVEVQGCNPRVFVDPAAITLKVASHVQNGKLYQGTEPTYRNPNATIDLNLTNIEGAGEVNFYTYDQNGLKFTATKFLTEDAGSTATVTLTGVGKSNTPQKTTFNIYNDSYLDMASGQFLQPYNADINIEPVNVDVLCTPDPLFPNFEISVNGQLKTSSPIASTFNMTIPVKVIAPGRGRIKGVISAGTDIDKTVTFISDVTDFKFNAATGDIQNVIIKRDNTNLDAIVLSQNVNIQLSMVSGGVKEYISTSVDEQITTGLCSYVIDAALGEATFTYNGNPSLESTFVHSGIKYITPKTTMEATGSTIFKLLVPVTVSAPGVVEFKTNTINGVYFEGVKKINSPGNYVVELPAFGKSDVDLPKNLAEYTISKVYGVNTEPSKTLQVDYVYRPMRMYSIGGPAGESWQPAGAFNIDWGAAPFLVRNNTTHFGWNGVVRVASLNFIDIANVAQASGVSNYSDLGSGRLVTFNSNLAKSDFVLVGAYAGNTYAKDNGNLTALSNYAKANHPVIFAEGSAARMNSMVKFLYPTTSLNFVNNTDNTKAKAMNVATTKSNLIYGDPNTYFGKKYGYTMTGKFIAGSTLYVSTYSNVVDNTNFEVLSYLNNTQTSVFAFLAKDYPFVGIGNSAFFGGRIRSGTDTDRSYPLTARKVGSEHEPNSNSNFVNPDTSGTVNVDNSMFMLNLIHWAIDYAQEHQPNVVKQ